jgi:phosphoribosyl 1,2-cyclic phosphodiesterase
LRSAQWHTLLTRRQAVAVLHGEDYTSNGFVMGPAHARTVYISDVSRVPPETLAYLKRQTVALLVVDALLQTKEHPTHFSLAQAVELARQLQVCVCLS